MRLKYKKLTVFFTMGIMMIGLITFSMVSPSLFGSGSSKGKTKPKKSEKVSDKDVTKDIQELINNYFAAKVSVDMEKMEDYVTDISYVNEEKLMSDAEWIEDERNIDCKIYTGAAAGEYRVYVYHDVKIYNIDALVPGLNALYITTTSDGKMLVYNNELDEEQQAYIKNLDESEEIKELTASVAKKYNDLVESDEQVRNFYQMLEGSADVKLDDGSQDKSGEAVDDQATQPSEGEDAAQAPADGADAPDAQPAN